MPHGLRLFLLFVIIALASTGAVAQGTAAALGSETAKNGFKNEDEIRDKFIAWKTDADARAWLSTMGYKLLDIISVAAVKPSGQKSDVDVTVETKTGKRTDGISIKLVSSPHGFNQIDKRW